MDYIGIDCPVCEKTFVQDDDIVVCPECGTPHHRECYELNNKCVNHDKHDEDFIFNVTNNTQDSNDNSEGTTDNIVVCPKCKAENPKEIFYCNKCGFPIGINQQNNTNPENGFPYRMNGIPFDPFDPMAGIDPGADMGDEVKAGELAKYVQKNTSYFLRVFSSLKDFNRGRFSFVGFIFGGGYLLYRKMYKLGAFLTTITAVLLLLETFLFFTPQYSELVNILSDISANAPSAYSTEFATYYTNALSGLDTTSIFILAFINISAIIQLVIKIVIGVKANKWYFKHCKKQIITSKINNSDSVDSTLETKGGVNNALAISLLIVYMIISYLPYYMSYFL